MQLQNQLYILGGCYCLLFLLCLLVWKLKGDNLASEKVLNGNWILLHIRHAGGVIIMAVLPLSYLPIVSGGMFLWPASVDIIQSLTLMITGLILLTIVVINRYGGSFEKPVNQHVSSFHAAVHIVLRLFFLISYEWFFRGCILFICINYFGTIPAVIINLVLYALIHSFSSKKEIVGSVPFGLILCVFTVWYQSVWPAIFLHLILSSSHEFFLLSPGFKNSKQIL